ncbi:MAG: HDOD domain-containing protein [Candidatus Latescibacterota bacterium]
MSVAAEGEPARVLFVEETEQVPRALTHFLRLLLQYRYGQEVQAVSSIPEAMAAIGRYGSALQSLFLIKDAAQENRNSLMALGHRGQVPLFLLVPRALVDGQKQVCRGLKNVYVCAWEDGLHPKGASLHQVVVAVFEQQGIARVAIDEAGVAPEVLQQRVEQRLKHVASLPTLPEVVLRVLQLLNDPNTTIEDLEQLLLTDPAIVHRLLRVVSSPAFAGRRTNGQWTLREAVVRLGLNQVGAIVQQIALINALVQPERNPFDLRRFWEHSVACAVVADKLYVDKLVPIPETIPFDHYWIGGLLHDVGKLVMGFFFWDAFDSITKRMATPRTPFHWGEMRLGNAITHEYLSRVVLTRAKADPRIVEAVAVHDTVGRKPGALACLLHLATNLSKDLRLGYLEREEGVYSQTVLSALGISDDDVARVREQAGPQMISEARALVGLCLGE